MMSPRRPLIVALAAASLAVGCVPSLHALHTDKDLVFEEGLLGTWKGEDSSETWTFTRAGENAYELVCTDKDTTGKFEARLLRLGKHLFIDLFPRDPGFENKFYALHFVPAHTFGRIVLDGDDLRLGLLSPDWLKKMISEKRAPIRHETLGSDILLTASTQDLQKLAREHAEDHEAFDLSDVLCRQTPSSPAASAGGGEK